MPVWPAQKAAGAKLAREWLLARDDWRISPSRTCVRWPGYLGQIWINQTTMTSLFIRDSSHRWSMQSSLVKAVNSSWRKACAFTYSRTVTGNVLGRPNLVNRSRPVPRADPCHRRL